MPHEFNPQHCSNCGTYIAERPNEGTVFHKGTSAVTVWLCAECYGFCRSPDCPEVRSAGANEIHRSETRSREVSEGNLSELYPEQRFRL